MVDDGPVHRGDDAVEEIAWYRRHAAVLAGATSVRELGEAVDAAARATLRDARRAAFYVRDGGGTSLRLIHSVGFAPDVAQEHERTAWDRHPGRVIREGRPLLVRDMQEDPGGTVSASGTDDVRSRVWVPLKVNDSIVGAYGAVSPLPNQYDEADAERMMLLCELAAIVWQRLASSDERRRLEEQLVQSQKMELVGRLVGSIAHDFNNALSVLMGRASLIDAAAQDQPRIREHAQTMLETCDRAAHLTRRLLAFTRPAAESRTTLLIPKALRRFGRLIESMMSEATRVRFELDDDPDLVVHMAPAEFEQIILNLVVNARDAMPSGGELVIGCRVSGAGPHASCVITISDSGSGIAPADRERIFEPFYTTKPAGAGTGLGLSTVRTIVNDCGGRVRVVDSDRGATFEVALPLDPSSAIASGPLRIAPPATRSRRRVWLAEDEDALRLLFSRLLEHAGHEVVAMPNGRDLLDHVDLEPQGPDVLVTDVVMPRLGGVDVVAQMRERFPRLPVIFITGYEGNAEIDELRAVHPDAPLVLLRKPFPPDELIDAVDRIADLDPSV